MPRLYVTGKAVDKFKEDMKLNNDFISERYNEEPLNQTEFLLALIDFWGVQEGGPPLHGKRRI